MAARLTFALGLLAATLPLSGQTGEQVLLVVNSNDAASREIAAYYRPRRSVPVGNVCTIATTSSEEIPWEMYQREIEQPIGECLKQRRLTEKVLYIVTTLGLPLKFGGGHPSVLSESASVDSELTLLYGRLKGMKYPRAGAYPNPFYMQRDAPFTHARFPIYLVTRLAAYDVPAVKGMIDRSLAARNRGRFVLDLSSSSDGAGNSWLRTAAILLPAGRVVLDESERVLTGQHDVIGYASWGSNDPHIRFRHPGFTWLPGGIATEFVSSDGRSFHRPPDAWQPGGAWSDSKARWEGTPQSLSADYIMGGATGVSGHVYEPYLQFCPRPDYVLPAYYQGRNLAESFYLGIPGLSWMNIVLGDPLCSLGKPPK